MARKHTHISVIQERKSLRDVFQSEDVVRRSPKPVKLKGDIAGEIFTGGEQLILCCLFLACPLKVLNSAFSVFEH